VYNQNSHAWNVYDSKSKKRISSIHDIFVVTLSCKIMLQRGHKSDRLGVSRFS